MAETVFVVRLCGALQPDEDELGLGGRAEASPPVLSFKVRWGRSVPTSTRLEAKSDRLVMLEAPEGDPSAPREDKNPARTTKSSLRLLRAAI